MTSPPKLPLVVVIGPSGSGKSSVVRHLARRGLVRVHPTWTTRPRRPDERQGSIEHRFVSDADFDAVAAAGGFLDTIRLFGLPHRYGLPPITRSTDGRVDVVMLRAPLLDRFAAAVPDERLVVQIEAPLAELEERLRRRGGSGEELRLRLEDNERELRTGRRLADHVVCSGGARPVADVADEVAAVLPLGVPA
jgi:guanylate kinase